MNNLEKKLEKEDISRFQALEKKGKSAKSTKNVKSSENWVINTNIDESSGSGALAMKLPDSPKKVFNSHEHITPDADASAQLPKSGNVCLYPVYTSDQATKQMHENLEAVSMRRKQMATSSLDMSLISPEFVNQPAFIDIKYAYDMWQKRVDQRGEDYTPHIANDILIERMFEDFFYLGWFRLPTDLFDKYDPNEICKRSNTLLDTHPKDSAEHKDYKHEARVVHSLLNIMSSIYDMLRDAEDMKEASRLAAELLDPVAYQADIRTYESRCKAVEEKIEARGESLSNVGGCNTVLDISFDSDEISGENEPNIHQQNTQANDWSEDSDLTAPEPMDANAAQNVSDSSIAGGIVVPSPEDFKKVKVTFTEKDIEPLRTGDVGDVIDQQVTILEPQLNKERRDFINTIKESARRESYEDGLYMCLLVCNGRQNCSDYDWTKDGCRSFGAFFLVENPLLQQQSYTIEPTNSPYVLKVVFKREQDLKVVLKVPEIPYLRGEKRGEGWSGTGSIQIVDIRSQKDVYHITGGSTMAVRDIIDHLRAQWIREHPKISIAMNPLQETSVYRGVKFFSDTSIIEATVTVPPGVEFDIDGKHFFVKLQNGKIYNMVSNRMSSTGTCNDCGRISAGCRREVMSLGKDDFGQVKNLWACVRKCFYCKKPTKLMNTTLGAHELACYDAMKANPRSGSKLRNICLEYTNLKRMKLQHASRVDVHDTQGLRQQNRTAALDRSDEVFSGIRARAEESANTHALNGTRPEVYGSQMYNQLYRRVNSTIYAIAQGKKKDHHLSDSIHEYDQVEVDLKHTIMVPDFSKKDDKGEPTYVPTEKTSTFSIMTPDAQRYNSENAENVVRPKITREDLLGMPDPEEGKFTEFKHRFRHGTALVNTSKTTENKWLPDKDYPPLEKRAARKRRSNKHNPPQLLTTLKKGVDNRPGHKLGSPSNVTATSPASGRPAAWGGQGACGGGPPVGQSMGMPGDTE